MKEPELVKYGILVYEVLVYVPSFCCVEIFNKLAVELRFLRDPAVLSYPSSYLPFFKNVTLIISKYYCLPWFWSESK